MTGQQAVPLFGIAIVAIGAIFLMVRDYKLKKKKKSSSSSKSSGSKPRPKRVKRRR